MKARLPEPAYVNKMERYQRKHSDPVFPWGGSVATAAVFGFAGVFLSLNLSLLFFLLLLVPISLIAAETQYRRHSAPLYRGKGDYDDPYKGIYQLALEEYKKLYDESVREEASDLLTNVYRHEVALTKIDKQHRINVYRSYDHHTYTDCDKCNTRIELIRELAETQRIPGTLTDDIDTARHLLEGKKEIKSLS